MNVVKLRVCDATLPAITQQRRVKNVFLIWQTNDFSKVVLNLTLTLTNTKTITKTIFFNL